MLVDEDEDENDFYIYLDDWYVWYDIPKNLSSVEETGYIGDCIDWKAELSFISWALMEANPFERSVCPQLHEILYERDETYIKEFEALLYKKVAYFNSDLNDVYKDIEWLEEPDFEIYALFSNLIDEVEVYRIHPKDHGFQYDRFYLWNYLYPECLYLDAGEFILDNEEKAFNDSLIEHDVWSDIEAEEKNDFNEYLDYDYNTPEFKYVKKAIDTNNPELLEKYIHCIPNITLYNISGMDLLYYSVIQWQHVGYNERYSYVNKISDRNSYYSILRKKFGGSTELYKKEHTKMMKILEILVSKNFDIYKKIEIPCEIPHYRPMYRTVLQEANHNQRNLIVTFLYKQYKQKLQEYQKISFRKNIPIDITQTITQFLKNVPNADTLIEYDMYMDDYDEDEWDYYYEAHDDFQDWIDGIHYDWVFDEIRDEEERDEFPMLTFVFNRNNYIHYAELDMEYLTHDVWDDIEEQRLEILDGMERVDEWVPMCDLEFDICADFYYEYGISDLDLMFDFNGKVVPKPGCKNYESWENRELLESTSDWIQADGWIWNDVWHDIEIFKE